MDATQQEFYTVCISSGCARWFRTTTGGINPATGQLDPAQWQSGTVSTQACSYPFVATSPAAPSKVFAATTTVATFGNPPVYRFFEGTDGTGPQGEPIIQAFTQLASSSGPIELTARATRLYKQGGAQETYLAIPRTQCKDIQHLPNIAVDPVDANIVYLVYHDTLNPNPPLAVPPGGDEKVDVFFVKLTKNPTTGFWSTTTPVAITDVDPPGETNDNFHAAIYVTPGPSGTSATTRIHVVFYSDRRYPSQVDTSANDVLYYKLNAKFNAYYKYSDNGGTTWQPDQEIIQIPDEPAVDFTISPAPGFDLNDYLGLTARPVQNGYEVWTSFMGSRDLDTAHHPSVIHASRVPWPN